MSNKLLVGVAVLALGIAAASCEKTQNEEPAAKQSPSATSEGQKNQSAQADQSGASESTKAQQPSSQTASQAPGRGEEQQTKGGQQEQRPEVATNTQDNLQQSSVAQGQPSLQDRTSARQSSAQSETGAPAQGQAQPNQPQPNQAEVQQSQAQVQQSQVQLNEQKNQPGQNHQAAGPAAGGPVSLGRDQVRQAQMLLKEKGFDVGEVDGVLGPRTRRALIAFQRRQGLEASGQIDQRTAGALGLSNGPTTTSGHSGAGAQ
jgi:hypothetical protein